MGIVFLEHLSVLCTWNFFSPGILRLLVFFNRAIRMIGVKIFEIRPLCKRGT